MSTTTTGITTTTGPTTTPTTACGANVWQLPTRDAACAAGIKGNYSSVFSHCCKEAPVERYDDDCGLYCLAQGQSVGDLLECLTTNGASHGDVFCSGNMTATATASASSTETSGSRTGSSSASETSSSGAAQTVVLSKSALGLLAMLFCSALTAAVV